jgi:hypothetical protein
VTGAVEFVVEKFDKFDEFEFDEDAFEAEPPRRSLRILAVLVAVAITAAWVASRPSGAPRRTAAPLPAVTSGHTVINCRMGAPVVDEIAAAMRRFLPGIVIDNLAANRCIRRGEQEPRVVAESVTGTVGGVGIDVEVSLRTVRFAPVLDAPVPSINPATRLGTIETESAGVRVRASVTGPPGSRVPMLKLQRLADFLSLNLFL